MQNQIEEDNYIRTRFSNGTVLWHKKSFNYFDVIEKYTSNIWDTEHSNIEILKIGKRRRVFKFNSLNPFVVKSYPLLKIHEKLNHKKYGLQEFQNYRSLVNYNFIPKHHAYFENRNWFKYSITGNVVEYISGKSLKDCLADLFAPQSEVLNQLICLISLLHKNGIYHNDLSGENIILNDDGLKIIDWQYCSLIKNPCESQLILMLSHLIRTCNISNEPISLELLKNVYHKCSLKLDFPEFHNLTKKLSDNRRLPQKTLSSLSINDIRKITY